jgi:hypothetical protein
MKQTVKQKLQAKLNQLITNSSYDMLTTQERIQRLDNSLQKHDFSAFQKYIELQEKSLQNRSKLSQDLNDIKQWFEKANLSSKGESDLEKNMKKFKEYIKGLDTIRKYIQQAKFKKETLQKQDQQKRISRQKNLKTLQQVEQNLQGLAELVKQQQIILPPQLQPMKQQMILPPQLQPMKQQQMTLPLQPMKQQMILPPQPMKQQMTLPPQFQPKKQVTIHPPQPLSLPIIKQPCHSSKKSNERLLHMKNALIENNKSSKSHICDFNLTKEMLKYILKKKCVYYPSNANKALLCNIVDEYLDGL